ncbi:MAG: polysaccharide biosynthesis/export family protein [Maribacter sp.]
MKKKLKVFLEYKFQLHQRTKAHFLLSRMFPLIVLLLASSCYTSKGFDYLQSDQGTLTIPLIPARYTVQPNDVLSVKVQSRDPEQAALYNTANLDNSNVEPNAASLFLSGYTVNRHGIINMANVGELKVSDLSIEEIGDLIQSEIDKQLVDATVSVKLTSFKVSVLGDVKNPGTNYIYNAQVNIFEALSAAGDLNISAKRKKIKLIRQQGDKSKVVNLDLRDPMIIHSPYYLLHPNDVLYVETSKPNLVQKNLGTFGLILSAITTTILVLSFNSK